MSEGKINSIGKNILTSSPYTIYQAGLLAWLVTGDIKYGVFTFLAVIMGDGANYFEKKIARYVMEKLGYKKEGARPNGCGTSSGENCTGCGIYSSSKTSHTWGMPSGHAQITSFAATYWTIYVWIKYREETDKEKKQALFTSAIVSSIVMWLLAFAVWSQRVYSKCHSIFQIIVGMVIGIGFGILGYWVSSYLKNIPNI